MAIPEPDVTVGPDLFVRRRRSSAVREQAPVVAAVALGGAVGACARYGIELAWPAPSGGFPWATLLINVSGCALMGALMVAITELWVGHRLLRPLLGTGVLGGYTTFSTFASDVDTLAAAGQLARAVIYLLITPVLVLVATWTTAALTRRLIIRRTA
ncbi:fluoride efflux transporter CrcB [Mycolicibacter senuensis]|jgi:CrcB protein|nr:fluoride efflux transporter CrcB [Mycolicibacter senuensis]ORW66539.1 CrcB protein [Mycolicibacter senuensis]GFG70683.1 putative fluoride ion transporter CrcB 1 [Mycolicibacter senuensis]